MQRSLRKLWATSTMISDLTRAWTS